MRNLVLVLLVAAIVSACASRKPNYGLGEGAVVEFETAVEVALSGTVATVYRGETVYSVVPEVRPAEVAIICLESFGTQSLYERKKKAKASIAKGLSRVITAKAAQTFLGSGYRARWAEKGSVEAQVFYGCTARTLRWLKYFPTGS